MKMPIGFRFYPTEEELISFYLQRKLDGRDEGLERVIPQLYIYHLNPWDLPGCAGDLCEGEREQWFFFVPRQEKELRGGRPNRLTSSGYWKATGSPNNVYSSENRVIGEKRTMVFYEGRANSSGKKTDWKMNEYRAVVTTTTAVDHGEPSTSSNAAASSSTHSLRQEFSICRVYLKSKCLRAFDRRPFGGVEASSTSSSMANQSMTSFSHDQDHNSRDHASTSNVIMSNHEKGGAQDDHLPTLPSTSSDQQQIRVDHPTVEIANSPESSSTGDHANTLYDMDIEEPVWDWKEFDMF